VGDTTRAWQQLERGLRIDSTSAILRALELAMRTGLRGEDPATIEQDLARAAQGDELFLERASLEALRILAQDPARAFAVADSITAIAVAPHRSRTERLAGLQDRVGYRLSQGRYREAWELLEQVAALEPASVNLPFMRALYPLITGLHVAEGRAAARWLATTPNKGHLAQLLLGLWALEDGDSALLAAAFHGLGSVGPGRATATEVAARVEGLRGLTSLQHGDTTAARMQLELAYHTRAYRRGLLTNTVDVRFALELARVERATGALAAAAWRTYYAFFGYWGSPYRGVAEELLAQIAEQRGDTATAIRAYQNLVQLWKDADPELRPRVSAAQAALARLERE
jgi:tetratricopeptide (TPR) repeat protein